MFKVVFSFLAAFVVTTSVCSAADLDPVDYYSLSPVQSLSPVSNSALDYGVSLAFATSWDTSDQAHLAAIRNALTFASTIGSVDTIFGWVQLIGQSFKDGIFNDILDSLETIDSNFTLNISANEGSLLDTVRDLESLLTTSNSYTATGNGYLYQLVKAIDSDTFNIRDMTQGIWADTGSILDDTESLKTNVISINSLVDILERSFSYDAFYGLAQGGSIYRTTSWERVVSDIYVNLVAKGNAPWSAVDKTLYQYIMQLSDVLASDDDLALANFQKANREEIEDSFLNGSSGSTSLGVSDFGDLADVGGTIKNSLSLDGNATIGSFTSGLAAADSAGQGWFSEETRSQLDTVSSTMTYSLRDPDPYNMAGWEDRYYWLLGDDE